MLYSILGYQQTKLVSYGLNVNDALILKYISDFVKSGKMVTIEYKGDVYFWIDYKTLLNNLPILNLKKDSLYRKLKNLVNVGMLKHYTKKEGGTFSFFSIGENYEDLLKQEEDNTEEIKHKEEDKKKGYEIKGTSGKEDYKGDYGINVEGGMEDFTECYGIKTEEGMEKNQKGYGLNIGTKDYLIKNYFNNNSINKESSLKNTAKEVIEYLNCTCNKTFSTKCSETINLISKLLKEGYCIKDFKKVIDSKSREWYGTKFWKFLRPETLFGKKFYGYLEEDFQVKGFNNFQPRQYDYVALERKLLGWE